MNKTSWSGLQNLLTYIYNPSLGVGYVFISNLIASLFSFILLTPMFFKEKMAFDKVLWRKMIIYALPLLIAGFAGIINETIDRILLKFLLPENVSMSELGIYSACYKISIIITIFIQAFRFAADPFFFSQSANKNAKEIYASVMKYFIIACLLIFLFIMMYIDVVKYFVGEKYHEGLHVVPILLLANVFLGVFYNLSIWYKLSGRTIYGAYLAIFGALLTLVLNFLWIPVWGYTGAAWATLVCYFSMMVASFFIGQKHFKVDYNIKNAAFYLGVALAIFALSIWIKPANETLKYVFNSVLLLSFLTLVVLKEKKKLTKTLQ